MATALGWDVLFNGLPKKLQTVDRTKGRLGHLEYRRARELVTDAINNNLSMDEIKTVLDDEGLVWNEEQRTLYITRILKELGRLPKVQGRPKTYKVSEAACAIQAIVTSGVNKQESNMKIYETLVNAGYGNYYTYKSLAKVCTKVRKRLGIAAGDRVKSRKETIMAAKDYQLELVSHWTIKCRELLQTRSNLSREDLEYVAEKVAALKDERLKECIATLIGWGDEERAELETFCAIALEAMKLSSPSKLRDAARNVEIRYLHKKKGG